jgi:hypothetical protein
MCQVKGCSAPNENVLSLQHPLSGGFEAEGAVCDTHFQRISNGEAWLNPGREFGPAEILMGEELQAYGLLHASSIQQVSDFYLGPAADQMVNVTLGGKVWGSDEDAEVPLTMTIAQLHFVADALKSIADGYDRP